MALESLPTSTFGEDAPPPSQWLYGPTPHSAEERFQDYGRGLAWADQRANETPGPDARVGLVPRRQRLRPRSRRRVRIVIGFFV
jgi:hypothetical protein